MRITDERTLTIVDDGAERAQSGTDVSSSIGTVDARSGSTVRMVASSAPVRWQCPADDPDAPDLGFVGDVESIDTALIELLLSRQFVPVVMPIGVAVDGTAYHINSDLLAGRLARALGGRKAHADDQRRRCA